MTLKRLLLAVVLLAVVAGVGWAYYPPFRLFTLYAAGRNAIGIASNNYVSGLSLADGVWSGRRAAMAIAGRERSRPAEARRRTVKAREAQAGRPD